MTDDWECLIAARGGDEHAWRVLFERHYPMLVRMISYITGSLETAQDLAQESFVRLLRAEIRHHDGSFKSFLSTIASSNGSVEIGGSTGSGVPDGLRNSTALRTGQNCSCSAAFDSGTGRCAFFRVHPVSSRGPENNAPGIGGDISLFG